MRVQGSKAELPPQAVRESDDDASPHELANGLADVFVIPAEAVNPAHEEWVAVAKQVEQAVPLRSLAPLGAQAGHSTVRDDSIKLEARLLGLGQLVFDGHSVPLTRAYRIVGFAFQRVQDKGMRPGASSREYAGTHSVAYLEGRLRTAALRLDADRSPHSVRQASTKILPKLLAITEPEIHFRNRRLKTVGESFLTADLG
jgi:hypothetical protein